MSQQSFAVLGEFKNPTELIRAAKKIRDMGYRQWDTHSPFPIHGMDEAMGLKPTKLGWIVFFSSMCGVLGAFFLQWWSSTQAYQLVISGKPLNSYPAFVPITFEGGILFAALSAVLGMFILNRLPMWYHGLFKSENFKRVTDDKFFISIESTDPQYDSNFISSYFQKIGATSVEVIKE